MKKKVLQCVVALCFGAGVMSASAATSVPDYQDWWWNPAQSGMGVNVGQQHDTLVVAWYHFDTDGTGTYLMLSGKVQNGRLEGDLIRTKGPVPGAGFNPAEVRRSVVGTASMVFSSVNEAVLNYQFDNKSGSIQLTRYLFRSIGQKRKAAMIGSVVLDRNASCQEPEIANPPHSPAMGDRYVWNHQSESLPSDALTLQVVEEVANVYSLQLDMGSHAVCNAVGELKQAGGVLSGEVALQCDYAGIVIMVPPYMIDGKAKLNVKSLRINGANTQFDFELRVIGEYGYQNASFCPRIGSFHGFEVLN